MNDSRAARLARHGAALVLLGVAVYYAVWGGEYSAFDLRRLAVQKQDLTEQLTESQRQVDSLKTLAELLERDPITIERVARERFGMIREGEVLYRFVPTPYQAAPPEAQDGRISAHNP
jgi:cell division protein FtsB